MDRSAYSIVDDFAYQCGWTLETAFGMLADYVDRQKNNEALIDYLEQCVHEEEHEYEG